MAEKTESEAELLRHADLQLQKINKHGRSLRLYIVGATGVGKSSLVAGLVGNKAVKKPTIASGPKPCTMETTQYKIPVASGVSVLVYDTRGMFDTGKGDHEEATASLIGDLFNNDVNGVLLVCMKMHDRLDEPTVRILAKLHHKYGEKNIWHYAVFALTKADQYPIEWDTEIKWFERSAPILRKKFEKSYQEYKNYLKEKFTSSEQAVAKGCYIGVTEKEFDEFEIPILPTSTLNRSALSKMRQLGQEHWFDMLLVECCKREHGVVLVNIHSERIANLPDEIIKKIDPRGLLKGKYLNALKRAITAAIDFSLGRNLAGIDAYDNLVYLMAMNLYYRFKYSQIDSPRFEPMLLQERT